jgi:hypothetical protein
MAIDIKDAKEGECVNCGKPCHIDHVYMGADDWRCLDRKFTPKPPAPKTRRANAELIARVRELERLRYGAVDERAQYYAANLSAETCDLATQLADALEQVEAKAAAWDWIQRRADEAHAIAQRHGRLGDNVWHVCVGVAQRLEQVTQERDRLKEELAAEAFESNMAIAELRQERDRAREIALRHSECSCLMYATEGTHSEFCWINMRKKEMAAWRVK